MAMFGNGSAKTVHLAFAERVSKNGNPPKGSNQHRLGNGSREKLKGPTMCKNRPSNGSKERPKGPAMCKNNWQDSRAGTSGFKGPVYIVYTICELDIHTSNQMGVRIRDSSQSLYS